MAVNNTYDLLIRYYETHITHRRHMLRFLLIVSGALLTGIASTAKDGQITLSIWLTILALLITIGFRALDAISYNKIVHCEDLLKSEKSLTESTVKQRLDREALGIKLGDNQVTKCLIYILFGFFFLIMLSIFTDMTADISKESLSKIKYFQTSKISLLEGSTTIFIFLFAAVTECMVLPKEK